MDCDALKIPRQQKRCDYLFIGEEETATWIAPIELKSGRLRATEVLDQCGVSQIRFREGCERSSLASHKEFRSSWSRFWRTAKQSVRMN